MTSHGGTSEVTVLFLTDCRIDEAEQVMCLTKFFNSFDPQRDHQYIKIQNLFSHGRYRSRNLINVFTLCFRL